METTYIKNARILTEDGVIPGALLCRNGVIEAVGSVPQPVDAEPWMPAVRCLHRAFWICTPMARSTLTSMMLTRRDLSESAGSLHPMV